MSTDNDRRLRRLAERKGLALRKDRARHLDIDHHGGWMIIDPSLSYDGVIVAGQRVDLDDDAVEDWLQIGEPMVPRATPVGLGLGEDAEAEEAGRS